VLKRLIDFVLALIGLLILFPVFLLAAGLIKLDSCGPVFFRQKRMGKRFRSFNILKFRTMVQDAPSKGAIITVGSDPRVTRVGQFLRKFKIDELPQLINVLKGDMSLVGPRPELPEYVQLFREDYEQILRIRPGITDLASLKYRNESALLAAYPDPQAAYRDIILPDKIKLAREYLRVASLTTDLKVILKTLVRLAD
jgi:lipopolysaccharide/colanic/teichoic acid biosynthesis glycosyltransferase